MFKKLKKFRLEITTCSFLILAVLIVYLQVQNFAFVDYDDDTYIINNTHVRTGLNNKNIVWAFTKAHSCNWHPLTWLSHQLDSELFGLDAGLHHLTSVFFHIINTILLFTIIRKMKGTIWQSAFIAVLFAVHPLNVESVAWISERKNVLSTLFWFLTIIIYFDYVKNPNIRRYYLMIIVFAFGLISKPMLVTLPFVLLLFDYWPLKRINIRRIFQKDNLRLVIEKIPLFIMIIISSTITIIAQRNAGAVATIQVIPMQSRLLNIPISYIGYITKMIWPDKLAFFYPFPHHIPIGKALISALLLAVITVIVIKLAKKQPYLAFGWFWYVGTLVPVIGLVQVGSQAMADRYAYISLIGLFVLIAWIVQDVIKRKYKKETLFVILTCLVFVVLLIGARSQTVKWKNSVILFEHAIRVTKNNYLAHNNLGSVLYKSNRLDAAITHYNQALRINPNYAYAHNSLGAALVGKGEIENAKTHITKAIQLRPDFAEAYNNLGSIFGMQGNVEKAILYFRRAVRLKPDYVDARNNLRIALSQKKNGGE